MPTLRNAGKNLARLRDISVIVVRYGFGGVLARARVFQALGFRPEAEQVGPTLSPAKRFRMMLAELGPTFVKLGQVLSSRPDLLPPDFVEELSLLQDQTPPLPFGEVQKQIEEGLGHGMTELFASFDEEPLASASIAQVHAARTLDGEDVVVKVQRPGIEERIRSDLDLLYYFAQLLERVVAETGITTPTGIVDEFQQALVAELDFFHEAANVRQFRRYNEGRSYVVIPRTLERLRGQKITDCDETKFDRKEISKNLIEGLFQQLFIDGFFHGDPHPGNIFVLEGNRVGLVDFGLVGRMSRHMQETVILLCLAVALKDPDTVARLVYKAGIPSARVNLSMFQRDIADIIDRYINLELRDIQSTALVQDLLQLALRYQIKVPKEYAVLLKTAITIEGVVRKINPELDILEMATPYAKRLLTDRLNPKSASGGTLRTLLQVQTLANELPMQLSQILLDMESGKFSVEMKSQDLPQLVQAVRWLGIVVFSGLTSAALITGAFILLAQHTTYELYGIPVIPVLSLLASGGLFLGAFGSTLLAGRVRKVNVGRWIKRLRGK
jgi:ubiquinone biosynthesis protein